MGPRKIRFADHVAPPVVHPFKSAAILAKDGADVKMHSDQKHALTNKQ
jgi:hypothetical protein